MPYTVIPPCSSGSNAKITYQFSGQSSVVYYAEDYLITRKDLGVDRVEHFVTVSYVPMHPVSGVTYDRMTYTTKLSSPFIGGLQENSRAEYYGHPVVDVVSMRTTQQNGLPDWNYFSFREFPWLPSFAMAGSITVSIGSPTGVVDPGWFESKIAFYKNGLEIHSSIELNKTITAVWECSTVTCPFDTCPVDCGSQICCYNSQGISVFNYSK